MNCLCDVIEAHERFHTHLRQMVIGGAYKVGGAKGGARENFQKSVVWKISGLTRNSSYMSMLRIRRRVMIMTLKILLMIQDVFNDKNMFYCHFGSTFWSRYYTMLTAQFKHPNCASILSNV